MYVVNTQNKSLTIVTRDEFATLVFQSSHMSVLEMAFQSCSKGDDRKPDSIGLANVAYMLS